MNKKEWNVPAFAELGISETKYSPNNGTKVDGSYVSKDGKHTYFTYAPSGNGEEPR